MNSDEEEDIALPERLLFNIGPFDKDPMMTYRFMVLKKIPMNEKLSLFHPNIIFKFKVG